MEPHTEFIGHLDIEPPLDDDETDHLLAWSQWVPCHDGCCLVHDGAGLAHDGVVELRALIKQHLGRGRLEGMVVGCETDGRLVAITVASDRVTERILQPGSAGHHHDGHPLDEADVRDRARGTGGAVVIDLASRRA